MLANFRMIAVFRMLGIWAGFLFSASLIGATEMERIAFDSALRAFEDRLYSRAKTQFSDFTKRFPDSDRFNEARAFAMRARAHELAMREDHAAAAAAFRNLREAFPNSPNHLEFVVGEAWSQQHQKNWNRVIALLGSPKSPFKLAASIRPNDPIALPLVVRGQLLLAQAHLDLKDYHAARHALNYVTDWDLQTEFSWRRRLILTRLQLAEGKIELALQNAETLLEIAEASEVRAWIAESAALRGEAFIADGQTEAALLAYQKNLAPDTPPARHREAWFKIIALNLEQRDAQSVIELLEEFVARFPKDPSLDVALLTLGDLNRQRFYEENRKSQSIQNQNENHKDQNEVQTSTKDSANDYLNEARMILERIIQNFPKSSLISQAQYHRGWCYWELGETSESVRAFAFAAEHLPKSQAAAEARFKLADGLYVLGRHREALAHYQRILEEYEEDETIRESFLDQVLYQTLRAAVAAEDVDSAQAATRKLIAYYPDTLLAQASRLLVGQHLIHIDKISEARGVFYEMIEHFTQFPLRAEVDFAIAYSFELEGNWAKAEALYEAWLKDHSDHEHRPRVVYALAWCANQQGKLDQASDRFSDFIRKHEMHPLTNLARLWLGNHFFNQGEFARAARHYEVIMSSQKFQNDLAYRAALMAARAHFRLGQISKTIRRLTKLSEMIRKKDSVSANFKAEVELGLGDALFEGGKRGLSTMDDPIGEARLRFARVAAIYPGSRLAAMAWGRTGDASYFLREYDQAISAYREVLRLPESDIAVRSQAEMGLAMSLERQAEIADSQKDSDDFFERALQHYLNIVYLQNLREGELPDPFWLKEAGLKAAHLVEAQQNIETGVKLYLRLAELIPTLRADWEKLRRDLENTN